MGSEARKILENAMALSPDERAELARELIASLDGEADPGAEAAWTAEITRRAERVLSGESRGVPWETVKQDVRAEISHK